MTAMQAAFRSAVGFQCLRGDLWNGAPQNPDTVDLEGVKRVSDRKSADISAGVHG